jgi:hypothetical protein
MWCKIALVDWKNWVQYGFTGNSLVCISLLFLNYLTVLNWSTTYVVLVFIGALGSIYSANKVQKSFISPKFADKKCPFCDADGYMTTLKLYCTNCRAVSEIVKA